MAQPGVPLYKGSVISTGKDGSAGLTLKDSTILSVGPQTVVSMEEFAFDPGGGQLQFTADVAKGTMQYVSGVIAKLRPESVAIRTPTGLIGVRGTHFVVKVEEGR